MKFDYYTRNIYCISYVALHGVERQLYVSCYHTKQIAF